MNSKEQKPKAQSPNEPTKVSKELFDLEAKERARKEPFDPESKEKAEIIFQEFLDGLNRGPRKKAQTNQTSDSKPLRRMSNEKNMVSD